jgi:presenilin-like A22 family membrane protease
MAEEEPRAFKPRPRHLYPVILSLAVTGVLGYPLSNPNQPVPQAQVTPFQGDTLSSAGLNAVIFVIALGASATAMFLIVRGGRMKFIRSLIKAAVLVVSFAVAFWYTSSILFLIPIAVSDAAYLAVVLGVSLGTAAAIALTIFGKTKKYQLIGVTLIGALTGIFLGYSIGPLTALVLIGALVIYDIIAVFRGPVGALAKSIEEGDLPGAVFTYGDLTIGMGDMVFYSLLATTALVYFGGLLPFFGAAIGILTGTFLGFKALSKYEMFPGLPFSLLLGVAGMLIVANLLRR